MRGRNGLKSKVSTLVATMIESMVFTKEKLTVLGLPEDAYNTVRISAHIWLGLGKC